MSVFIEMSLFLICSLYCSVHSKATLCVLWNTSQDKFAKISYKCLLTAALAGRVQVQVVVPHVPNSYVQCLWTLYSTFMYNILSTIICGLDLLVTFPQKTHFKVMKWIETFSENTLFPPHKIKSLTPYKGIDKIGRPLT